MDHTLELGLVVRAKRACAVPGPALTVPQATQHWGGSGAAGVPLLLCWGRWACWMDMEGGQKGCLATFPGASARAHVTCTPQILPSPGMTPVVWLHLLLRMQRVRCVACRMDPSAQM